MCSEARKDARARFQDREPDLARGVEVLQSVGREHADRVVQFGASSTPVAPAPTIAMSITRPSLAKFARKHVFTSRRWKRCACHALSMVNAWSRTPGVPKSFDSLPIAITSVS
jgi:hypothetical protein